MKLLYLSFANNREHPLEELTKEDEEVYTILDNNKTSQDGNLRYTIFREQFATIDNVNRFLSEHKEELTLFHYSGHAGEQFLLLNDAVANANGIAYQIAQSASNGILKLVVLNGCSTARQVKILLELEVPVVIATNAPIGDKSARIFSIRFYGNMASKGMTIREAFEDALAAAQVATPTDLGVGTAAQRDISGFAEEELDKPLWGLFYKAEEAIDTNPFTTVSGPPPANYRPNKQLTAAIFEAVAAAGNPSVLLIKAQAEVDIVADNVRQQAFLAALPYPVAVHLQKLFSAEQGADGFDQIGLRRLEQIGRVFHVTMEFMGFIMVAQLWDLKMIGKIQEIPPEVVSLLKDYFYLTVKDRAVFDYIAFIRRLRAYFDSLGKEVTFFVEELEDLRDDVAAVNDFGTACDFLYYIRKYTVNKKVFPPSIPELCVSAENMLSRFFQKLGFLHRYTLTSIQEIHIRKYRHTPAEFSHQVVKLMNAISNNDINYYLLSDYLDNSGVVLTKQKLQVFNAGKRQYRGDKLEFLNLSPFVIDLNAFELKADRSKPMFFDQCRLSDEVCVFKSVKEPESTKDDVEISIKAPDETKSTTTYDVSEQQERYEAVRLQFMVFRAIILNEQTQKV
jgi:hypothetical protein